MKIISSRPDGLRHLRIESLEDAAPYRASFAGAYQDIFSEPPYNERFYPSEAEGVLTADLFDQAPNGLLRTYDSKLGGFGRAPKFPPSMTLEFLLRMVVQHDDAMALRMTEHTLEMMARGGIYDQLGGGFARYSTDDRWLAPHFEKMLYDNALLARVYLHAWQLTGRPLYRRVVEETLDFVVREMRHAEGGFYSSYDADSEGEEGKFYVWSAEEIRAALGPESTLFMAYYDISDAGNWEGHNILNVPRDPAEIAATFGLDAAVMEQRLAMGRQTLYDIRARRVWPGLDDKVLTAWNGLMLAAFAEAGRALGRPDYTDIATQNAEFLYTNLRQVDGRLLRSWGDGAGARYNAYLEDDAFLADGLLALYQTTFEPRWFLWARELAEWMLTHFQDPEGGFFATSDDHEALLHRPKDTQDNATPSGNSMAAGVLLTLSLYTGEGRYWDMAESMVAALAEPMMRYPGAFSHWLCTAALIMAEPREVAIVGDPDAADTRELLDVLRRHYRPAPVAAVGPANDVVPLLADRPQLPGRATAYVCRRFVCLNPVTQPEALAEQLL